MYGNGYESLGVLSLPEYVYYNHREFLCHPIREQESPHHPIQEQESPHHPIREQESPHHPIREQGAMGGATPHMDVSNPLMCGLIVFNIVTMASKSLYMTCVAPNTFAMS